MQIGLNHIKYTVYNCIYIYNYIILYTILYAKLYNNVLKYAFLPSLEGCEQCTWISKAKRSEQGVLQVS
jgi:hypothetical protein